MGGETVLSYAAARFKVRQDLVDAHLHSWQRIALPGTWFSGGQRVAIAAETRNAAQCRLCHESAPSADPVRAGRKHDSLGRLPEPVVETIHRVRNQPGSLNRAWFDSVLSSGIDEASYIEVVAVAVQVFNIDTFCRGIGLAPHKLPAPSDGEPSRLRPAGARPEGAWVPMVSRATARGPEANLYPKGNVPNIGRALSLVPAETRTANTLIESQYIPIGSISDFGFNPQRAITRPQMELLAGRVSANNKCFY